MSSEPSNPYRPGAGRFPPELAGRANEVTAFAVTARRATVDGEYQRPVLLVGRRGMGKTVLLTEFMETAKELKLVIAHIEVTTDTSLSVALVKAIHIALRRYAKLGDHAKSAWRKAASVFRSFQMTVDPSGSYSFGVDVDAAAGFADTGDLTQDLYELFDAVGEAARDSSSAMLIVIDELQLADQKDINSLNVALHRTGQGKFPVPVIVVGAGLPSLLSLVSKSTAYGERLYEPILLEPLDDGAAASAFTVPSKLLGVEWTPDALDLVTAASRGYPFFIQEFGSAVWDARTSNQISADDVDTGVTNALEKLDQSVYRARWKRATSAEKEFLRAMSVDGEGPSLVSNIAARVGADDSRGISRVRDNLITKNAIFVPDRGHVAYTVPGMAEYIQLRLIDD